MNFGRIKGTATDRSKKIGQLILFVRISFVYLQKHCLVDPYKHSSVNWMVAGSRLPRSSHVLSFNFSNTPHLTSLSYNRLKEQDSYRPSALVS